jgi:Xaa-Pro dipeptidase
VGREESVRATGLERLHASETRVAEAVVEPDRVSTETPTAEAGLPVEDLRERIRRFQTLLREDGLAGALVVQNVDRYYFTGTMQSGYVVIPVAGDPVLLVRKDPERAAAESPFSVVPLRSVREVGDRVRSALGEIPSPLGLELDVLPVTQAERLKSLFPGIEFGSAVRAVARARAVKSPFEVEQIRRSAQTLAEVVETTPQYLQEGVTEVELAARLECELRLRGHGGATRMRGFNQEMFYGHVVAGQTAATVSFADTPIGGRGTGAAMPLGASTRRIGRGEPVVVDLIGNHAGYLSDMTRVFSLGPPAAPFEKAFEASVEVRRAVVEAAAPGVPASDLYRLAAAVAADSGFGEHFMGEGHKVSFVGHGLGLEVDEMPFLASGFDLPLEEGMVFALEPKFTFAGRGVVGEEDTYLVTSRGLERLTPSRQGFRVLDGG